MGDEQLNKSDADECIGLINTIINNCKKIKTTMIRIQSSTEINPFRQHYQKHMINNKTISMTNES